MNEKQKKAVKEMNQYDLLEMYNSYYLKVIKDLVPPAEVVAIFDGLRLEILERMQRG